MAAVEIGVEDGDAVGRTLAILVARGARQQHDLVGDLRGRGPDLLAVDDVPAGSLRGESLDPCGVESCIGFGETEGTLRLAGDEIGNPFRLLIRRAVDDDRVWAEQVDVNGG